MKNFHSLQLNSSLFGFSLSIFSLILGIGGLLKSQFINAAMLPSITPMVGYQRERIYTPVPHDQTTVLYGARLRFGPDIIGIEGQYMQGDGKKVFEDQSTQTSETKKARVGLSSIIGAIISLEARAGAERTESDLVRRDATGGLISESHPDPKVNPYAGAGIQLRILPLIRFFAGVTYTFVDQDNLTNLSRQIAEYSAGFSVRIGL
jgi:hypothetical protein